MKVLVINSGSSSIKFQLFQMPEQKVIASGLVEKIGLDNGEIHYKTDNQKTDLELEIPDHSTGLKQVIALLIHEDLGVISDMNEIEVVGHRVVHGGKDFVQTTRITPEVKAKIKDLFGLAPLHNPANLTGIEVAEDVFPNAVQIAVFDTSFHQTLPEVAYTYAIPLEYREKGIRVYGFHGISHQYVSQKALEFTSMPDAKLIVIHLGNGCSMTAVQNGKSVEHTLGFGPNEGLMMGTRSGDIDQAVIFYLMEKMNMNADEISNLLTKKSGMLGVTGDSDLRHVEERAAAGDTVAQLALNMKAYRIKKYIGAYAAAMNGLDVIAFTAGIGENSDVIRNLVCKDMSFFGIELNEEENNIRSKEIREISTAESRVKVLVIPTNEELEIAVECNKLLDNRLP